MSLCFELNDAISCTFCIDEDMSTRIASRIACSDSGGAWFRYLPMAGTAE